MPDHPEVSFAALLIAAHGRPMERALIRARQRYDAAKPSRQRVSALHRAYAGRKPHRP